MTLIGPTPHPFLTTRRDPRRAGSAALLSAVVLACCCYDAGAQTLAHSAPAKAPSADAEGGNPKFYEVFGKRYRVRPSSDGYRERGVASWYGRPFHGRPTSSGEMYDMNEMTAAHTSLPLPTWVEVTNLSNGKTIVVKVNDRGPFVANRLIDLSYAAANALDIVRTGTARVEIRALGAKPPVTTAARPGDRPPASRSAGARVATAAPAATPTAPAKPPSDPPPPAVLQRPPVAQTERLFAQAGKFKSRADAVELVDELKAEGLVNAFIVTEDGRRKSVHHVRVGPLPDDAEVERMSDRLRGLGAKRSRSVVMQ
jgi:peptidoglycan lytic transglycosylase